MGTPINLVGTCDSSGKLNKSQWPPLHGEKAPQSNRQAPNKALYGMYAKRAYRPKQELSRDSQNAERAISDFEIIGPTWA